MLLLPINPTLASLWLFALSQNCEDWSHVERRAGLPLPSLPDLAARVLRSRLPSDLAWTRNNIISLYSDRGRLVRLLALFRVRVDRIVKTDYLGCPREGRRGGVVDALRLRHVLLDHQRDKKVVVRSMLDLTGRSVSNSICLGALLLDLNLL